MSTSYTVYHAFTSLIVRGLNTHALKLILRPPPPPVVMPDNAVKRDVLSCYSSNSFASSLDRKANSVSIINMILS